MKKLSINNIFKILSVYIVLQPVFDILSNLYIDGFLKIPISTVLKPIFVFILAVYLFFKYCNNKKKWILYGVLFLIFMVGHYFILSDLYVSKSIILHEFRFLLNIIYMLLLFLVFEIIYKQTDDKKFILDGLKKTVIITFFIYLFFTIIAVLTTTSGMTYEYADKLKRGYKGWFDSGQILGHAISIMLPVLLYTVLKPRNKWYIKISFVSAITLVVSLLGTKVPYFIMIAVYILYILISIFNKIFNKYYKLNIFNITLICMCIFSIIITYKYTPVAYNTELNRKNLNKSYTEYNISVIDGSKDNKSIKERILNFKKEGKDTKELELYDSWSEKSSKNLIKLYKKGKLHPSNMRAKEFYYSSKKYELSTIKYKIFGIGFLNQEDTLALETDFFMALFSFGIIGFICLLGIPIYEFLNITKYMLKNIKNNDLETYLMYVGFGVFFSVSICAGYTYIYTNFSIFLVLLITMLKLKIYINEERKKNSRTIKKLTFLMLHLGYGGIETSTINTVNALSKYYDIDIISFYNLSENQENLISKKVKIKYLYNGGPNIIELKESFKSKKILKFILEGIKSLDILIKKKLLIIKYIKKSKSDVIVSTRVEFSILLSKYGNSSQIKIAQEHRHHNDDKCYINKLSKKYDNIDYLFALTQSLKEDYEKFLINNHHTKICYVPNMIKIKNNKKTNLKTKRIISVGRLHIGKRINELIDIFSSLKTKDSQLYIIGDGDEFQNISNQIKKLKIEDRVFLLGYKDQKQIEKYLLDSRVFAMTSITEGLPMVLLEAMSRGVPCIAYRTSSGVGDIIDDNVNGYIINNRNKKEYIKKLDTMLNDDSIVKEFSQNAISKSLKFKENSVIDIWEQILNDRANYERKN